MVALTKVQKLKRFCLICILLNDTECKPYEIKIVLSLLRHNLYFQRTAAYKKHMFPLFLENRLAYLFRSVLCQTRVVQNLDALFFRRGCSKSGQMFEIRIGCSKSEWMFYWCKNRQIHFLSIILPNCFLLYVQCVSQFYIPQ